MNPLFVTTAANDSDLRHYLSSAIPAPIPCGDAIFNGADGVRASIERKKIPDMVACIHSGRYLNQARNSVDHGFNRLVIIVEGVVRPGETGLLETIPDSDPLRWVPVMPETTYYRFNQYLDQLSLYCGILVKRSETVMETAAQVMSLYRMLQCHPEEHKSLNQMYVEPPGRAWLVKPSLVRRVAHELPGIGWERSGEVAGHFKSVREMCMAGEEEWGSIPGIGRKTARGVVSAIGGDDIM